MGVGGQPKRRFRAGALALTAVLIGLAGTSASAFAAGPKPDPPPVKRVPPPPPPQPAPPPPPTYVQPPPPPPAVYHAPPSGPTAAQILAAQRVAARAKAVRKAKAQRLKKLKRQRRAAEARRVTRARERATARKLDRAQQISATFASQRHPGVRTSDHNSVSLVVLIAAVTMLWAVLVAGLGLVSRSRMSAVLEEHHVHFAFVGGMVLLSVAVFSALTVLR